MSSQPTDSAKQTAWNKLNHQASLYSLAAAAAGVSVLASASPATAEVVVTKAHLPIIPLVGVSLDLNHDGVADFYFSLFSYKEFGRSFICDLNMVPLGGGAVVGSHPGGGLDFLASALARGAKIGPSAQFGTGPGGIIGRSVYERAHYVQEDPRALGQ